MINQEVRKQTPKRGLGRGLASLLPAAFNEELTGEAPVAARPQSPVSAPAAVSGPSTSSSVPLAPPAVSATPASSEPRPYFYCPIEDIVPNPNQPRKVFDSVALDELASSIQTHGLLSPIVVRKNGAHYEIIAGERRWRASKKAGLSKVPVLLKEVGEKAQYQLALIENIQRANLNPIEEAMGYEHLMEAYGWTQEKVAEQIGKDRTSVTNSLRLLKLPQPVIDLVNQGKLAMGHAKAILGLPDPQTMKSIAYKAIEEGWSVRMIENVTRSEKPREKEKMTLRVDPHVGDLQKKFENFFKTKVELQSKGGKGEIRIHFSTHDQLNKLAEQMDII